jgi:hypothetical protein
MSLDIAESDWKIFKELHPIALDRFFTRSVKEIRSALETKDKSAKEQFWRAFDLADKDRKQAAQLFDDYRRSTAMLMTAALFRRNLITEPELNRFSQELREQVKSLLNIL